MYMCTYVFYIILLLVNGPQFSDVNFCLVLTVLNTTSQQNNQN